MGDENGMQPAVVTLRPDNIATIGLIGVVVYFSAVFLAQLAMRAGLISSAAPSTNAAPVGAPGERIQALG